MVFSIELTRAVVLIQNNFMHVGHWRCRPSIFLLSLHYGYCNTDLDIHGGEIWAFQQFVKCVIKISTITKLCIKISFKIYVNSFSSSCTCIGPSELWGGSEILQKKFQLWVFLSPILRILIIISNALYLTSYLRMFVSCYNNIYLWKDSILGSFALSNHDLLINRRTLVKDE